jgi:hypothetical protein
MKEFGTTNMLAISFWGKRLKSIPEIKKNMSQR